MSESEAAEEIEQSKYKLERMFGRISHFAWPYGRFSDFTAEAAWCAADADFESIGSSVRGCHAPRVCRVETHTPTVVPPYGVSAARPEPSVPPCLRRDSLVATWSLSQVAYYLSRSTRNLVLDNATWPTDWQASPLSHHEHAA